MPAFATGLPSGQEPLTVRLAPCGSAVVRFLNRDGQPTANYRPNPFGMQILVRTGYPTPKKGAAVRQHKPDELWLMELDRLHYDENPRTDAAGRLTLPALIPGARYRISDNGVQEEFTARSGRLLALSDLKNPYRR